MLTGNLTASAGYADEGRWVRHAYATNLAAWCSAERRWADRPFRRLALTGAPRRRSGDRRAALSRSSPMPVGSAWHRVEP
jgi:hypothetical protein